MKFSYNWLKELSGTKKKSEELCQMVMLKGFELEEKESLAKTFEGFVVGKIKSVRKHKDADKLQVALLDLGSYGGDTQIVCGARNIEEGQRVPVALPGSILPQSKLEIKETKIRGEKSKGMLCSESELGLGKDSSGILILEENLKPGVNLVDALALKDEILDFDILPNRAHDCLSHQGMAGEIAAMEGKGLKRKSTKESFKNLKKKSGQLEIQIQDKKLCPRYMGAILEKIKIKTSPSWMQARLIASGLEPINNVVDITNYVMLEIGNPLHAFDAKEIAGEGGKTILARRAKKGEKLTLLDESELELSENDLVIADNEKPLALAGIKGGKNSGISSQTSSIILEAANFSAYSIRKSRQKHSIQTDSQARFEKGISPVLVEKAIQRAVELLEEYAEGEVKEIAEDNSGSKKEQVIDFDFNTIEKLLGKKVPQKEALKILKNLGFEIEIKDSSKGKARVPYWRLDIEGGNDLAEEVGRIIGYEKIKPVPLKVEIKEPVRNRERELEWEMKDILAGLGFDEVINYSFYGEEEVNDGKIKEKHWELENPIASDQNLMRQTLLPLLVNNTAKNRKNFDKFSLFEIGRVYRLDKDGSEKLKIGGVCFDKNISKDKLFYQSKGKLEVFLENLTNKKAVFLRPKQSPNNFFHPHRAADIFINDQLIGVMGEFNPELAKKYKVKEPFCLFEMDFNEIFRNIEETREFQEIQKLPSVQRDLAMFVDPQASFAEVKEIIKKSGGKYLQEAELFDIYMDEKNNHKSFAFHLRFYNPEKTLTGEEADRFIGNIIEKLEKSGIKVRKNQ
ncbi:MAG: phenylalanine--tRNA ligase subunit beta [Candidatus Moraniibacteriota bacterium]